VFVESQKRATVDGAQETSAARGCSQGVGSVVVAVEAIVHVVVVAGAKEVELGEVVGEGLEHDEIRVLTLFARAVHTGTQAHRHTDTHTHARK